MRLLIIEDENAIAEPLKVAFEKRNFAVDLADNGSYGLRKAQENSYDCVILDLNLPELDGLEVAKRLRAEGNSVPILMLTARSARTQLYSGFEAGTNDYLAKPFDFQELLYRVQALIKTNEQTNLKELKVADLVLNLSTFQVTKAGKQLSLNAKEYGILEYLLRNRGKIVSQEELLEHVWNENVNIFTQTVRTNVKTLRKQIDPQKKLIKTLKGRGYVIE